MERDKTLSCSTYREKLLIRDSIRLTLMQVLCCKAQKDHNENAGGLLLRC